MLSAALGTTLVVVSLVVFSAIGLAAARRGFGGDTDRFLTARGTQAAWPLALNFFASVLGAWILFAPAEAATLAGLLGLVGYAFGQGIAIGIFAWLGPQIRERVPMGTTLLDWVRVRFGEIVHAYVGSISVLYMFVFLAAELTAVGGAVTLLSGTDRLVAIIAVAAATAIYTAWGGLPASLVTDRFQGKLVLALVTAVAVAIAVDVDGPGARAIDGGLTSVTQSGLELLIVLIIAITAANLFHQGFWQRVWAAKSDRALRHGAVLGGILVVPVIFVIGLSGLIASSGEEELAVPALALFTLLDTMPSAVLALVVVLAVTLAASSVDTLQNALAALVAVDVSRGRLSIGGARLVTLALTVPAVVLATEGISVLRLFLVADLLAATIAIPVFLGLWWGATSRGALAGCVMGLVGVIASGWILDGSIVDGFRMLTLPDGPELAPFVAALIGSGVAAVAVALLRPVQR